MAGQPNTRAGGTYGGKSVFISTEDGGHSFTISPLPSDVGNLYTLDCTSTEGCSGLAANWVYVAGHSDATFLSTSNGGTSFSDSAIIPGDSMESLSCSSSLDCTAVGTSDVLGVNDWTAGVAARTTDGGRTWAAGVLPGGLGISQYSELSCADALHCSVSGNIGITVQNPPQCAAIQQPSGGATFPESTPSAAVQAIAQVEARAASAANLKAASSSVVGILAAQTVKL